AHRWKSSRSSSLAMPDATAATRPFRQAGAPRNHGTPGAMETTGFLGRQAGIEAQPGQSRTPVTNRPPNHRMGWNTSATSSSGHTPRGSSGGGGARGGRAKRRQHPPHHGQCPVTSRTGAATEATFATGPAAGVASIGMATQMLTLETRRATLADASAMSRLTLQLGYDCNEVMMRQRLTRLRDEPDHAVFVAGLEG